tara:strand:+ start:126 stop:311 length:186 start_codon:yes stop_codon:yes gene_type:complete
MRNAEVRSVVEGFEDRVDQIARYLDHVEAVLSEAQSLDRSLAVTAMGDSVAALARRLERLS